MNDDEKLLRLAKALIVKATQHNDLSFQSTSEIRYTELAVSIALHEVAQELINIASNENPSR